MMHPVQDSIGPRREVRATLANPGKDVEELFPIFVHYKHLMSCIPVKEKTLTKQGEVPVKEK
ncbi:hypothetical protein ADIS_2943 [Lunatimonas lonarensis]|uniref:Uncharacterized protein n=1 Tax=Lunatimonas lonarensis TaxID=1232681 RepID=R7ZR11_9BACT|nr:hypothetical protein ADIS_2943 [Lunatimonas lonarensis]